jgi:N-acetylmuramic acid 6-phosphate etherase
MFVLGIFPTIKIKLQEKIMLSNDNDFTKNYGPGAFEDDELNLITEQVNPNTYNIDECSTEKMLMLINREDHLVPRAIEKEIPTIARAVDAITERMSRNGRLFYIGAGTSGRIGVLDASECPPTFGVDSSMVQAIIAGGEEAIFRAVEVMEDKKEDGIQSIARYNIGCNDSVIGIAASGRTPFVVGAMEEAKRRGALTIGLCNNENSLISKACDICIAIITGPEVIMGSTRMKAGTSQKLVLNMISTSVMIKLGKVYNNFMVDMRATNSKLIERSINIIRFLTGAERKVAEKALRDSGGKIKLAILMVKGNLDLSSAEKILEQGKGLLKDSLRLIDDK